MARILIAGCGQIGTQLGLKLLENEHEVWGLRRKPHQIPSPIKRLGGDLTKAETLKIIPRSLDWVFIILTADQFDDRSYEESYVESTRNLLALIIERREKPIRTFFASSTGVYGQSDGEWVDETSPTTPQHFSGRRILEAENLLKKSPLPSTCIRFAGIYGPERTRFIDRLKKQEIWRPVGPPVYRNLVHSKDVIGILTHLITLPQHHSVYNAVDNEPVSYSELVQWVSRKLGISENKRISSKSMISNRNTSNKRCCNHRLVQSGYTFIYPSYREGYGKIIGNLRHILL